MEKRAFNPGIEILRLLAIVSVFFAHFSPYPSTDPRFGAPAWYLGIIAVISTIGVPLFFVISGYLFREDQGGSLIAFIKTRRYIIPWLIWATCLYCLFGLTGEVAFSLPTYLGFIIGDPSIYYFLTLLVIFEVLAFCLRKINPVIPLLIILPAGFLVSGGVFRLILETPGGVQSLPRVLTYSNPLIFLPAYWLGRVLSRIGLPALLRRWPLFLAIAVILGAAKYVEACLTITGGAWSIYFSPISLAYGLSVSLALFMLLPLAPDDKYPAKLIKLGKLVLPVYLFHLLFTGAARQLFTRWGVPLFPWHLAALPIIAAGSFILVKLIERLLPPEGRLFLLGVKV